MTQGAVIGWDLGGAHVKLARSTAAGRLTHIAQHSCPLWKGIHQLDTVMTELSAAFDLRHHRHALTMTGELADIFPNRRQGVHELLQHFLLHVDDTSVRVYSMSKGLRTVEYAGTNTADVASANWHATATLVARQCPDALLLDVGSTTTDIISVRRGKVDARGRTDGERLRSGELLYSGVVRTPLIAVAEHIPFDGDWQTAAAELFATIGDVYILTGQLRPKHYQAPTADGAGVTPKECARRLARMLGRDVTDEALATWQQLAQYFAGVHADMIRRAVERALSRRPRTSTMPIVGAGCGRFLARAIARQLRRPYHDVAAFLRPPARLKEMAAICAPAVAVARLLLP